MWLLLLSLIALTPSLAAQNKTDEASPIAWRRAAALDSLDENERLALCRKHLDEGAAEPELVSSLVYLGQRPDAQDLARVLRYISDLDPCIADAAMEALRAHGADGLKALRALDDRQVDAESRRRAVSQLLQDHIYSCCRRDMAINPYRFNFKGRFAELYSVEEDVDTQIFELLREARGDIRDDVSGRRYYYYGYNPQNRQPFIDYGGLAVAAVAHSKADALMREFGELANPEEEDDSYYFWSYYRGRSPVTLELATFFARQGKPALVERIIAGIEGNQRGFNQRIAQQQLLIAALQAEAQGDHAAALERVNDNIKNFDADDLGATQAHYIRARLLMVMGEEGAALRALEDSMEASDNVMVLALVDDAFLPLRNDRRFQTIQRYCELAVRRTDELNRPWRPTPAGE